MASKLPNLPREVLDHIIDQTGISLRLQAIHANQTQEREIESVYQTLRTYLFVSRSFRRQALSYIFRDLEFTVEHNCPTDRLNSFIDILESSPFPDASPESLGWHIDAVSLSFENLLNIRIRGRIDTTSTLICQDSVIHLLRSLHRHAPKLTTLSMKLDPNVLVSWALLDVQYQDAFHALVRLNSLRFLKTINVVHFPVTFLRGTLIECLQMTRDSQPPFDSEDTSRLFSPPVLMDIDLPNPPLKMLVTDHSCPFGVVPDISPPGSIFSGLKALKSITKSPKHVRQTWLILSHAPLLETLFLHAHGEIERPPSTFNLGNSLNLRSLILHHDRPPEMHFDGTYDESLDVMLSFFNTSSPLPFLEYLQLTFTLLDVDIRSDFFYINLGIYVSQWEQLDKLFMGPKYPALKMVNISLYVDAVIDNPVFLAMATEKLRGQFPRLSSTDRVLFDIKLESRVTESRDSP